MHLRMNGEREVSTLTLQTEWDSNRAYAPRGCFRRGIPTKIVPLVHFRVGAASEPGVRQRILRNSEAGIAPETAFPLQNRTNALSCLVMLCHGVY